MIMSDPQGLPYFVEPRTRSQRRYTGRRFECTYNGCKKVYTRAEHLQRHQLNHDPKELFVCPAEGCGQHFVRKDLYFRHTARHEQPGRTLSSRVHGRTTTSPRLRYISNLATQSPDVPAQSRTSSPPTGTIMEEHDRSRPHANQDRSMEIIPATCGINQHSDTPVTPEAPVPVPREQTLEAPTLPPSNHSHDPLPLDAQSIFQPVTLQHGEANSASPSSIDEFATWLFDNNTTMHGQPRFLDLGMDDTYYPEHFQRFPMDALDSMPIINETAHPGAVSSQEQELYTTTPIRSDPIHPKNQTLSPEKWKGLIDLLTGKLTESESESDEIPQGNFEDEHNPFSASSMHSYLHSYWKFGHEYLPILHYPTFCVDTTHNYLLVAILLLGSSMLRRQQGSSDRGIHCANLLAWNLRGHVMLHVDASPPGRLWVFQTLLLLEVHDKLLASAALHERALVYYPTTLNLMRQSSTLFGRQVPKLSKMTSKPGKQVGGSSSLELSVGFFAPQRSPSSTPESWWEYWIIQEAIRRAAYSAFVLDITHSVMFGNCQTLVFHEIHLYLPCDRLLWSSNSPSEIGAVESSLYANGVKPLSFIDGLRKMINRKPCRTNPFGWLVLLAGLLSIISHMQQRDLLTSSLECDLMSSVPERWQPKLINALLWWKKEYEDGLKHLRGASLEWQKLTLSEDNRNGVGNDLALVLVLYHLGNINIYITVAELGVAAGAPKILGRPVSPFERGMINEKITRWACSPGAVHALYHAFELIKLILFRAASPHKAHEQQSRGLQSPNRVEETMPEYKASCDKLPNRSWALYFATMVIWAYGFNQDGPLEHFPHHLGYPPTAPLSSNIHDYVLQRERNVNNVQTAQSLVDQDCHTHTQEDGYPAGLAACHQDIQQYLGHMFPTWIKSSQDLNKHLLGITSRRNEVIGLLKVTDQALSDSTWELLDEAREYLSNAATMLRDDVTM